MKTGARNATTIKMRREQVARRPQIWWPLLLVLAMLLSGCARPGMTSAPSHQASSTRKQGVLQVKTSTTKVVPFDPAVNAPLPTDRIVAAYGIVGGGEPNGPASSIQSLAAYLPQLHQAGSQYAQLDPTHPVKLGVDLVINVIQPCSDFPKWCASWADDATLQQYVTFCQQHHLLLFFDLQLGTEPVSDALTNHLLPYLQKYSFTEVALDTEFHFPNTPDGYAKAAGYPCCLGWMNASEINDAEHMLAQISMQYHQPRKVLIVHQWNPAVLPNKDQIQLNPDVSLVLQSDGFGTIGNKLGDYQLFVQQHLLEYGGYKLFLPHPGDPDIDTPMPTPTQVMSLFPQPLFISYQ